ncbi:MAG: hypothetical protein HWQ38_35440 [Nostoc sp. NMS7]|uniref:hypothetical protein n=1 Tax=Nostoc sp. NMS7 TaxID=2815391 RepID=UPI0025D481CD|nr:hypothetical protein [Nostoc sp. NMS7]MBN3951482.1 hypothetical protein [Nostoc sp. NMS7]
MSQSLILSPKGRRCTSTRLSDHANGLVQSLMGGNPQDPYGFASRFSQGETLHEQVGKPAQRAGSPRCFTKIVNLKSKIA